MSDKLIYSVFWDEDDARDAVKALANAHFTQDEIGVLLSKADEEVVRELPVETQTHVPAGATVGAVVGALGGALVLTASGFLAAGPFLLALEGALAGGATGSVTGALVGMGYWNEEIEAPEQELEEGAILVGATTGPREDDAVAALKSAGADAVEIRTRDEAVREMAGAS